MMRRILITTLLVVWPFIAAKGELPVAATLLDPDLVWQRSHKDTAVSPDGKVIAYISKGAIWKCAISGGSPIKLADVPDTPTALMAMPQYAYARNDFSLIRRTMGNGTYNRTIHPMLRHVISLQWTPSQDGVVYALRLARGTVHQMATYRIFHVSLDGKVTVVATIERDVDEEPYNLNEFHVLPNRQFIVANEFQPVIWDVHRHRPRVTPFDFLTASSSSGKYLGIEIDTKEIVIVDEELNVSNRTGVRVDAEYEFDLTWSADERFAIYRIAIQGPWSHEWKGARVDLEKGEVRPLHGLYWNSESYFTGRGGEFVHWGVFDAPVDWNPTAVRPNLNLVPDDHGEVRKIVESNVALNITSALNLTEFPLHPAWKVDGGFQRFAVPFPRGGTSKEGYHMHLVDLDGRTWPFRPRQASASISPYHIIAFVDDGKTLVARNDSQLFTIPIADAIDYEEPSND